MKHLITCFKCVTYVVFTVTLGCYRTAEETGETGTETGTEAGPTETTTETEETEETGTEVGPGETGTEVGPMEAETDSASVTTTDTGSELSSDTASADTGASLPCENLEGYQDGAPWPTWQGCPSRAGRSNVVGPKGATRAWVLPIREGEWIGDPVIGKDGTVYLAAQKSVVAITPDGSLEWEWFYDLSDPGAYHAPAIHRDGLVVVQAARNGLMSALSLEGELIWQFAGEGYAYTHVLIDSAGTIYGANDWGPNPVYESLFALDAAGNERWHQTAILGFKTAALAPDGDIVVSTNTEGGVYKYASEDGSVIWFSQVLMGLSPVSVAPSGNIYLCAGINTDYRLVALSPDGDLDWELSLDQRCTSAPAIGADDTIFVELDSELWAVTKIGEFMWESPIPVEASFNAGGPLIDGDETIYVVHKGLYAYDSDGNLLFEDPSEQLIGSAALAADGTLYVPGSDGRLYAFRD